jgi:type I restriction enzyme M protein
MALSQDELNNTLWAAADSSRVQVDAGIYKDYALAMLFFKYISD